MILVMIGKTLKGITVTVPSEPLTKAYSVPTEDKVI